MDSPYSYKIVAFHPDTSNLQVLYYNEEKPDGFLFSIEIPLVNGAYLAGEALDAVVRKHAPLEMLAAGGEAPAVIAPTRGKSHLFDVGTVFVTDAQTVLFLRRPLVRLNGLPIPLDVV